MKALNRGYILGSIVVLPLLIALVNFLFFKGNDVTPELVDEYINKSETISLTVPTRQNSTSERNYESESKVYYPRLTRMGDGTRVFRKFIFFSAHYQKYFAVINFEFSKHAANRISVRTFILAKDATFSALVHPLALNSAEYGSRENPIPVFSKELLAIEGRFGEVGDEMQMHFSVSEEERRAYVVEYLEHFIDKKEFKRLFNLE